ncbi:hypothetical protein SNE26_23825 [Mucilaginibacter sp. cycad4]|uniref:hypothetical protein n=1 Tax=Mucilaginibacter sp. cycad4 TaxID=3342096 RepID=UPI002AAB97A8|nr:hypothetical protein [Mucilaginibacter gossypii]WPU99045.1 hypothetical protein SNE26_23825 [Mucilaginibacter gossypii]
MEQSVHRIHFEDRSSTEFERLVFAFLLRTQDWTTLEWLGETGADGGRDIWGMLSGESYCYQCANYRDISVKKVTDDIDKIINNGYSPNHFIVICGGRVTNEKRRKIKEHGKNAKISKTKVYSGVEFEELLRNETPVLIKRFVLGEAFPEICIPDFQKVNTDITYLVRSLFKDWLFHEIIPTIKTLYRIYKYVNPFQLTVTEMVFLLFVFEEVDCDFSEMEDINEFSFDDFIPFIADQTNREFPVLDEAERKRYNARYYINVNEKIRGFTTDQIINTFFFREIRTLDNGDVLEIFFKKDRDRKTELRIGKSSHSKRDTQIRSQ